MRAVTYILNFLIRKDDIMHLLADCDISAFIAAVKKCDGDIFFKTSEGDSLNLKSMLSQYLFASISGNASFMAEGEVVCENPSDYEKLAEYLV